MILSTMSQILCRSRLEDTDAVPIYLLLHSQFARGLCYQVHMCLKDTFQAIGDGTKPEAADFCIRTEPCG